MLDYVKFQIFQKVKIQQSSSRIICTLIEKFFNFVIIFFITIIQSFGRHDMSTKITFDQMVNSINQMQDPKQLFDLLFSEKQRPRIQLQRLVFNLSIDVIGDLLKIKFSNKWISDEICEKKKLKKEHNRQIPYMMLFLDILKDKIQNLRIYKQKIMEKVKNEYHMLINFFQRYLALLLIYFSSKTSRKTKQLILVTLANGTSIENKRINLKLLCQNCKKSEDQYPNLLLQSAPNYRKQFMQAIINMETVMNQQQKNLQNQGQKPSLYLGDSTRQLKFPKYELPSYEYRNLIDQIMDYEEQKLDNSWRIYFDL